MNQHGLARAIPPNVRYKIRKDSGFGCVACGVAIGQYEHIEPEFKDATTHDPARMTFLCGYHHDKVTRGYVSKKAVWAWKAAPWCHKHGRCHDSVDIGADTFDLWIGGSRANGVENLITIDDEVVLSVKAPEEQASPYRVSAVFHDDAGNLALSITENEWLASAESFDVLCEGRKVGVRTPNGFALKLLCFPPNAIVVDSLNMLYRGTRIWSDKSGFKIEGPRGGRIDVAAGMFLTADQPGRSLFAISSQRPGSVIGAGIAMHFGGAGGPAPSLPERSYTVDRNALCPCESGRKYKVCCHPKFDYRF